MNCKARSSSEPRRAAASTPYNRAGRTCRWHPSCRSRCGPWNAQRSPAGSGSQDACRRCQSKLARAWEARSGASRDAQSLALLQQLARGDPPRGAAVRPSSSASSPTLAHDSPINTHQIRVVRKALKMRQRGFDDSSSSFASLLSRDILFPLLISGRKPAQCGHSRQIVRTTETTVRAHFGPFSASLGHNRTTPVLVRMSEARQIQSVRGCPQRCGFEGAPLRRSKLGSEGLGSVRCFARPTCLEVAGMKPDRNGAEAQPLPSS
jgi:hypothetical protein